MTFLLIGIAYLVIGLVVLKLVALYNSNIIYEYEQMFVSDEIKDFENEINKNKELEIYKLPFKTKVRYEFIACCSKALDVILWPIDLVLAIISIKMIKKDLNYAKAD